MKKIIVLSMVLIGCANGPRTVVEADPNKPSWVSSSKISWVDGDQIFFHTQYSVRGDERVNGCFQLAKLDSKETLIREIAEDIRGQIDNAQQGISENTELLLSQVRSSEYSGKVVGMKHLEQYHERYTSGGVERIDCHLLSALKKTDYDTIKRQVLYHLAAADPDVKKAINSRAVKFFSDGKKSEDKPAETSTAPAAATPAEVVSEGGQ